ncbi:Nuclear export mediator factor Nemf [Halotydeus destructor]|nr:Nuclear export mediator factor Nemf [Halotydeus destructor]
MGLSEKIAEIEKEISRTQKNKATEYHLGQLRSKLVKYTKQLQESSDKVQSNDDELESNIKAESEKKAPAPVMPTEKKEYRSMKTRFSTLDLVALLPELEERLRGARVSQVYDIDNKTYLIKLSWTTIEMDAKAEDEDESNKVVLLLESGIRIHLTEFAWPKSPAPSGFTMKLRKHLKNKRLQHIRQLGVDRMIDIQFGTGEAAYHIVLELYDRGNIVIADHEWTILNILRPRKVGENEDVKLMVREKYPVYLARTKDDYAMLTNEQIKTVMSASKPSDNLRKVFNPKVLFGAALLEHCFIEVGLPENSKVKDASVELVRSALLKATDIMESIANNKGNKGLIIQKEDERLVKLNDDGTSNKVLTFLEFHPMLFNQHLSRMSHGLSFQELPSFDRAIDMFFSSIEGQKIDSKAIMAERDALKKLDNIKRDHEKRIEALASIQATDEKKASLIELNSDLVERALAIMRSAVANQISWTEISQLLKEAQTDGDPVACSIKGLNLEKNQFVLQLTDPYDQSEPVQVNIDLDLTSYANARKYYDRKRVAAKKEHKTIDASSRALKSAEQKTKQTLKEVAIKTSISKARRTYWFEKFFWAISSENYLMIAGRDAQQNELIVKRYMRPGDIYVHADLHGAASVVVKNTYPGQEIPPRTLEEAATLAISYSNAWEAKIVTRSWWVFPEQVSKTAPSGEYLTVGSFMIRGRKNYLPLSQLILGFGFLFKLDDESAEKHENERREKLNAVSEEPIQDGHEAEREIEVDEKSDEEESKLPATRVRAVSINEDEDPRIHAFTGDDQEEILQPMEVRVRKQKVLQKSKQKAKKAAHNNKPLPEAPVVPYADKNVNEPKPNQGPKRGQKSKLKKMKEKYKFQDDEERQLRMALLGSTVQKGNQNDNKKETKSKKQDRHMQDLKERIHELELKQRSKPAVDAIETNEKQQSDVGDVNGNDGKEENGAIDEVNDEQLSETDSSPQTNDDAEDAAAIDDEAQQEEDDHESDDEEVTTNTGDNAHLRLLNTMTGIPQAEDTLLFCIPVVAPYSSLAAYKFKVKVLPGTNRRGKAAKTALHLFVTDKTCTPREKDLLKATKDMDISRNLPAKLKITATNLAAAYKSKKKG